jgi:hypothetical protein
VFLFSESAIKVEVLLICVAFFRCLCFHRFGFLVG